MSASGVRAIEVMRALFPETEEPEVVDATALDDLDEETTIDFSGVEYVSPLDNPDLMEQHERLMEALAANDGEVTVTGNHAGRWV